MGDFDIVSSFSGIVESTIHHTGLHPVKIDVTKFDGKVNFGMWRCEVMDALCSLNLEDVLDGDECPDRMIEKVWSKMNTSACG
ncbi:hypothetical protein KSP39_PZI003021 [Platanthera zijinensis]|uniref:Uncharacterized protein n=1 Tax=Platanthera zijinensis TaxID=2320716 RepID=A0AAP0GC64_9ASPA